MMLVKILRKVVHYQTVAAILLVTTCLGCSDYHEDISSSETRIPILFRGNIEQECVTRVNDGGFTDGDRMGVFVVDYVNNKPGVLKGSGNRATNFALDYHAESGIWKGNGEIYWKDNHTPIDVYGYYPFEEAVNEVDAYPFTVAADQRVAHKGEMSAYEQSDFLWAKAEGVKPTSQTILLNYQHRMAGVKVVLQQGTGFEGDEWNKLPRLVLLNHTSLDAKIDLATGTVTPGSNVNSIIMAEQTNDTYRAVVVPQKINPTKSIITVNIDGVAYALNRTENMSFNSGKMHTFTIKINKRSPSGDYELSITNESIMPWENDELSHHFDISSYVVVHVEKEGTLENCLIQRGANLNELKNLKITGKLTDADFEVIRSKIPYLAALNLRETKMVHSRINNMFEPDAFSDNVFPRDALYGHKMLRTLILPESIERIASGACRELQLTNQLVIPNSVKQIDEAAFVYCPEVNLEIVLPDSIEYIGNRAFAHSEYTFKLKFPNTLRYIGEDAFKEANGAYGTFSLPEKLEYLGAGAFQKMGTARKNIQGDIVIPQFLQEIPAKTFSEIGFSNGTTLVLHDGVISIGDESFAFLKFTRPIQFPASLKIIGVNAFTFSVMQGTLKLPENLSVLKDGAFGGAHDGRFSDGLTGKLEIPKNISVLHKGVFSGQNFSEIVIPDWVTTIQPYAFWSHDFLNKVTLGKRVDYIGELAFNSGTLHTIICLNPTPPRIVSNTFDIYFDKVILEVPEESVELYRKTPIWNKFLNITAHKELAFNIPEISCLQKGINRTGIVRSESEWEITELPNWCKVTPMSGGVYGREEVTVTVDKLSVGSGNREGRIVFRLKNSDYTTSTTIKQYDYTYTDIEGKSCSEDQEILLHKASTNQEIPLFLVGDGFDAATIADGTYMRLMNEQMEHFFNIEPYRTYRNYFTVFTSLAASAEKGIQMSDMLVQANKFNTQLDIFGLHTDIEQVKSYAQKVSQRASNLNRLTILVLGNKSAFQSTTIRDWSGCNISISCLSNSDYPYDQRGLIQYELGGVNFGDFGTETVNHFDFIRGCTCSCCNALGDFMDAKKRGGFSNLSLEGNINNVPWKHLIFHPKYSRFVDIYEGGYNHQRGVFRSEIKSCMNTYIPYYSTICREMIVRRILQMAGENFNFERFVEKDKLDGRPEI